VRRFLAGEVDGPDAPFSTLIALEIFRNVPSLRSPGLLRHLIEDPPLGIGLARWEAYQMIGTSADGEDTAFLAEEISSADIRRSRLALAALGNAPRGREIILQFLATSTHRVPQSSARALSEALADSGLARDDDLIADLLEGDDSIASEAAVRAAGRTEHGRGERVVHALSTLATRGESADAVEALGASGPLGKAALRAIAEDRGRPPHLRLLALEALADTVDAAAAGTILAMLPTLESASDVQLAGSLAVQVGVESDALASGLRAWIVSHPGYRDDALDSLRTSRASELRRIGDSIARSSPDN
jgi:hypothetical protein